MGARVDSVHSHRPCGETALHIVAKWGDAEAIDILIANGADIDKQGEDRNTPLHYAAMLGRLDAAKRLVELGAACLEDVYGNTPSQLAADPEVNRYLADRGF